MIMTKRKKYLYNTSNQKFAKNKNKKYKLFNEKKP